MEVHPATPEARALQLKLDVVAFRVRVGDPNRLAFTKREEPVPTVESENSVVRRVEVTPSAGPRT